MGSIWTTPQKYISQPKSGSSCGKVKRIKYCIFLHSMKWRTDLKRRCALTAATPPDGSTFLVAASRAAPLGACRLTPRMTESYASRLSHGCMSGQGRRKAVGSACRARAGSNCGDRKSSVTSSDISSTGPHSWPRPTATFSPIRSKLLGGTRSMKVQRLMHKKPTCHSMMHMYTT